MRSKRKRQLEGNSHKWFTKPTAGATRVFHMGRRNPVRAEVNDRKRGNRKGHGISVIQALPVIGELQTDLQVSSSGMCPRKEEEPTPDLGTGGHDCRISAAAVEGGKASKDQ
ncbi:hypothetical protein CY34DRAFT_798968 [Suillus luteus UH-Slu-Lm8-n1]|uniref:Uncharacterized protein n=1 Tax=Suillus luteus UH-Slu-Lm8-n1 TaxID=930992 RepID=A0A0D0BCY7_9AGAM|nr:hypothetical protein CY34DRAFT_798968 [Suillus luteus UH-Slu-Lm8-n1]